MIKTKHQKEILKPGLLWVAIPDWSQVQMNMKPYFTTIYYQLRKHS
jgi:hypothetical protein